MNFWRGGFVYGFLHSICVYILCKCFKIAVYERSRVFRTSKKSHSFASSKICSSSSSYEHKMSRIAGEAAGGEYGRI